MKKTRTRRPVALACQLSALTLALAALAPLPAAAGSSSGVAMASAQTNPCAPKPPAKATPVNPCAPQKAAPTNPCAPKAASEADKKQKADKNCSKAVNPCAPAPKCDKDGHPSCHRFMPPVPTAQTCPFHRCALPQACASSTASAANVRAMRLMH